MTRRMPPATPFNLTPPELETLDQPPSWCNARGHIDRAACIEVGVAEVRRLAGCVPHKQRLYEMHYYEQDRIRHAALHTRDNSRKYGGGSMAVWRYRRLFEASVLPLPNERPARNGRGRVASGVIVLRARDVQCLHDQRGPRRLAGDFRTSRAPAMRDRFMRRSRYRSHTYCFGVRVRGSNRVQCADRLLSTNPNKGAARTKKLGLPADWSQAVRIEIWKYPRRIRPAYYFVCPCGCPAPGGRAPGTAGRTSNARCVDYRHNPMLARVAAAGLSTCSAGRKNPQTRRCPQRCLKLLMPLCTDAEQRDARVAQLWIDSLPASVLARARPAIARLTARYGPIFQPRMLVCPRCIGGADGGGVRYGNHPETARQGWRRRRGKADTAKGRQARVPLAAHDPMPAAAALIAVEGNAHAGAPRNDSGKKAIRRGRTSRRRSKTPRQRSRHRRTRRRQRAATPPAA